jgi:hypothetical protein
VAARVGLGKLWRPRTEGLYRDLLDAELEDLEAAIEEIEPEWYG